MPSESKSTSERMIDLFLVSEVRRGKEIVQAKWPKDIHAALMALLEGSAMERINAATQQENDLSYMAYRLEHIATIARPWELEDK